MTKALGAKGALGKSSVDTDSLTVKTHGMQKSSLAKYLMFQYFNAQPMIIH